MYCTIPDPFPSRSDQWVKGLAMKLAWPALTGMYCSIFRIWTLRVLNLLYHILPQEEYLCLMGVVRKPLHC